MWYFNQGKNQFFNANKSLIIYHMGSVVLAAVIEFSFWQIKLIVDYTKVKIIL